MRRKSHTFRPHRGTANAPVALLIVLFFLACHGAPDILHQSAHVEATGAHHGASAQASAGHAGESAASGTDEAAQSASGNYYAAVFLALLLGAALALATARLVRRVPGARVARSFSPPRPPWRPPPLPTPARLQVFRL